VKQFICTNDALTPNFKSDPWDEGMALSTVSTATDSLLVQWCPVGASFEDSDGYTWTRLPDVEATL
jgi:hypothetical protein